jgi:hypothetical protein
MTDLEQVPTQELAAELVRRGVMPQCRCHRWYTYLGRYDQDGYTIRCGGCLRAIWRCTC